MTKRASDIFALTGKSAVSIAKLILQSRRPTITDVRPDASKPIVILGNGPSLNKTIEESLNILKGLPTMAVNFFANAPIFREIKPKYYILVDPHFFSGKDLPNLNALWEAFSAVDWPMTLIVPVNTQLPLKTITNHNIKVATVNAIAVEGWRWLTDMAYSRGWGMPRPRNVLIPAIMAALQMGYKEIYITGADHSWMSTISVNENNEVVSIQPHFYKEDDREIKRINTEYINYPLHEIVHSFYIAFKSYHEIQDYAVRNGYKIYNSTPVSFIDAFERRPLPSV